MSEPGGTDEYQELYKKYRPQTFGQIVGQDRVVSSLKAAVRHQEIPTLYGFFGPRGCGKTSSAFVLSKAVNCTHLVDQVEPCGTCDTCRAIDDGTQPGVSYLSMANHGSVDDVRDLMDKAFLAQPVRRQVFILDEVHNLSRAAFDSLLIPVESQSMKALFILCSTNQERIPATVLSRLQSRKFTLVSDADMMPFLSDINSREHLGCTTAQLTAVIRAGGGSVRDALSALEATAHGGAADDKAWAAALVKAMAKGDIARAWTTVAAAEQDGYDVELLAEDLFAALRTIMLFSTGVRDPAILGPLPMPVTHMKQAAALLGGPAGVSAAARRVGVAITGMNGIADPRIHVELALADVVTAVVAHRAK